ncbi:MAG: sensor histidine kinase [Synechococcales cyanobacterium M58_A2018_015]|nr:sensor histidine kinase [Synechococcales cyanobacterium M58_A2018_015]MBF2026964.1 sensor histidine kinase [Leptolyngbyaceae cyanobacterium C42_A2020_001]
MTMPKHPFVSLRQPTRYVEWLVLLACLCSGLFSTYFRNHPQLLPIFWLYVGGFFALSWWFPVDRPLWQRRLYIAVEISLLLLALSLRLWFDLLMYFLLTKSCFLLPRRDVVLSAIGLGIASTMLNAWILPERIASVIAQIQSGDTSVYNVKAITVVNAINYAGASLFAIGFGLVFVAVLHSRQRAEALAQQVEIQAATLERTRIAREIHDSLGHSLTTLDVQLELAERLSQRDPTASQAAVAIAHQLAQQGLQDVRRSVQTLRQGEFDLNQAVLNLVSQMRQHQPLQVHCNLELPKLTSQQSHQLYCIIQEGLTNVQKHAQAKRVNLSSTITPTDICLKLQDDGIGFNPATTPIGFGLRGMQERVQLLTGQFKIQSAVDQGTSIQITIPRF